MKNLEFRISSGLKNIIGKDLITNDLIAIFELVKNSYDANAKKVRIVFKDIAKSNAARIVIIDDGSGMSYDDITDKFLFVGYSEKKPSGNTAKSFRDKIEKHRVYAGAKGIGRFSCDRLGSTLNLLTKKSNESQIHNLSIDWKKFEEDQKKEFEIIKPNYEEKKSIDLKYYDLSSFNYGTILEISRLNDDWDWKKVLKLKRYLQRLINPAQVDPQGEFKIFLEVDEFKEKDTEYLKKGEKLNTINGPITNFLFEKLGIKTTEITSKISEDGKKILTEVHDKGEFIFSLKEDNPYGRLQNVIAHIFFLNKPAKVSFTKAMGLEPVNFGSIFLYKNGIRIHPYGDEGDDWLGTEKRKTQGIRRFLSNRDLIGRIEVFGNESDIKEVSSRDGGVIKNESFQQLYDYIWDKVLRPLERFVVEGLGWDSETSPKTEEEIKTDSIALIRKLSGQSKDDKVEVNFNKNFLSLLRKKEVEKMPEVLKNLEVISQHLEKPKIREYVEKQIKSLKSGLKLSEKEKKNLSAELDVKKKETLFYQKSVSMDTEVIQNLNHTIECSTVDIKDAIADINAVIKHKGKIEDIAPLIDKVSIENEKIRVVAGMVSLANFNTKLEEIKKDIVVYIKEYLSVIKSKQISYRFNNDNTEFVTTFKPLEISILLDNFISNSKKANASILHISFKREKNKLEILFADNGKGVREQDVKFIFTRGFTTTKGSGIGLHHISGILKEMGGSIVFLGNDFKEQARGACFKVTIPEEK